MDRPPTPSRVSELKTLFVGHHFILSLGLGAREVIFCDVIDRGINDLPLVNGEYVLSTVLCSGETRNGSPRDFDSTPAVPTLVLQDVHFVGVGVLSGVSLVFNPVVLFGCKTELEGDPLCLAILRDVDVASFANGLDVVMASGVTSSLSDLDWDFPCLEPTQVQTLRCDLLLSVPCRVKFPLGLVSKEHLGRPCRVMATGIRLTVGCF